MPLVTRNTEQGNLFKTASEPAGWQDGDLWSDTTANLVKVNVSGTATDVGNSNFSAAATTSYSETIGDYSTPSTSSASSGPTSYTGAGSSETSMYAAVSTRHGMKITTGHGSIGDTLLAVSFWMKKVGSPSGTLTVRHRSSADTIKATAAESFNVSTVDTDITQYIFTFDGSSTIAADDRICFEGSWGDASNRLDFNYNVTPVTANVERTYYNGSWVDPGDDIKFELNNVSISDDDTATIVTTDAEANPWQKIDHGSSVNFTGIALYWNAATTETEVTIQTSPDDSNWTTVRTITVSNLTNGAWNYIRFNLKTARYMRIYGNSGSSLILSIAEAKSLVKTDAEVLADLGILEISSTDTSLALDGT